MKVSDKPIIVEKSFESSLENVWCAITELKHMKAWFFANIEGFEPTIGFKTSFMVQSSDRTFTHLWEILEVVPNQKITYRWRYAEYAGDSLVSFELTESDNSVLLRLITEVKEDFPDGIPEFSRESCANGWEYFISERLRDYLAHSGQDEQ